ncbi:MAG: hypothetical protein L6V93_04895 [Clostridiales bacterium]|nr:MAG: hypothetical protein L6V93_04895 [Clostridiales bacterium]
MCALVSGVGIGAEVLGDTHITQKGGRIMNIYGGSADEKNRSQRQFAHKH